MNDELSLMGKLYYTNFEKNYVQDLKTYIDRNNYKIEYEEQTININKFIARVIITDNLNIKEEFDWCEPTNSKKMQNKLLQKLF